MPSPLAIRTRPAAAPGAANRPGRRRAVAPGLLAAGLAAVAWAVRLHGTDTSAQVYRASLAARHGLVVWAPGWYGGMYPLAYSVATPLLAAALGVGATGVLAAGVAAGTFASLVRPRLPAAAWWFAVSTLIAVGVGQLPYLCGEAAGLISLWLALPAPPAAGRMAAGRVAGAAVAGVATALLSPLAAAFLVLAAGVVAVRRPPAGRSGLVASAAGAALPIGVTGLAFPGDGPFPFAWGGLAVVEALCVLVAVRFPGRLRWGAVAYGAATLASFLVANPLGGNATRLAESAGIPLVVGAAWTASGRRRAAALAALVPFVVWQWGPATALVTRWSQPPSDTAGFYRPLTAAVAARSGGAVVRVEVVPTRDHWESAFVPSARLVLARGWERQLDVARNPVFYQRGALTAGTYLAWLRATGTSFVALPRAPLDPAGRAEARLLRRRVPGLVPVWASPAWELWRVGASPGLASGGARVTALCADRVVVAVLHPGAALLRVRWTPYWELGGAGGHARLSRAAGGWTELHSTRAGTVVLGVAFPG